MWLGFIDRYSSLLERLFGKARIHSADRETVLALTDGHVWPTTLATLDSYAQRMVVATQGSGLWAGLGPLGPSLLSTYPPIVERAQSMARYLAQASTDR